MSNGAQALLHTMLNAGVDTCFSNPGTSEMHFVAALDDAPEMRAVLALFEGVATGAADGYARIAEKPAATLLHLGCGLGNGLANLHNARKARVPMLNIVGDHATYHIKYDAALQSDIETLAKNVSNWMRTSQNTVDLTSDALEAIECANIKPASISTLILPANVSWGDGGVVAEPKAQPQLPSVSDENISDIASVLCGGGKSAIVLGGGSLKANALLIADRIAAHTGAFLVSEAFPARIACGGGLPSVARFAPDLKQLSDVENLILVEALIPLEPQSQSIKVLELASLEQNGLAGLTMLANKLGIESNSSPAKGESLKRPSGDLTIDSACQAIAALMPDNSILCEESGIASDVLATYFDQAARHDVLPLTGDAIGQALPAAIGASVAAGDRQTIVLVDGQNAMPTIQSLWTMAREKLNILVLVLNKPLASVAGDSVETNFVCLSKGMGVPSVKVEAADDLVVALESAFGGLGPSLIELNLA